MKTLAPGIEVNDIKISIDEINAEVQYHPAESLLAAKHEAMRALVIREMLLQRASEIGLCKRNEAIKNPDPVIDALLQQELNVPEADRETCLRYFENNKNRFFTSPLFEVSHILYMAPPEDNEARKNSYFKAQTALARLKAAPELFETIAREESACSSSKDGGRLGQISRWQTMPAFEAALFAMRTGDLSSEPVATEVGYHIIKVHEYAPGQQMPFENVADWIAKDLHQKSWEKAFHQYIQLLAGRCKISGFRLAGVQNPLVQ